MPAIYPAAEARETHTCRGRCKHLIFSSQHVADNLSLRVGTHIQTSPSKLKGSKTDRQDQRFIKDVHAIVLLYLLKDQLAGLRPAHPPCHGLGPGRTVVHLHTQAEN
ncbi:hypothetical protein I7I48_08668 [Histoplasma ohiense]|nr:hypothetical protein I7I48_08668 [Histoplasma ohiense (nom. inval.)]